MVDKLFLKHIGVRHGFALAMLVFCNKSAAYFDCLKCKLEEVQITSKLRK